MVFSSLLFVFAFFTPHLVVYFFAPKEKKNLVLLVSSLIFYAWGGPKYLLLLMLETFISWYFALKMKDSKKSKLYMIVACICLLGLLAIFKYTGFFLNNLKFLFIGLQKFQQLFCQLVFLFIHSNCCHML